MAKIVISSVVSDEFLESYLWYAKQSERAARKFQALVREAFDRAAANPMGGTVYDAGHRFYRLKKYPHLVIYRYSATDDTVTIVAVSHPSQDQSYWQNR